MKCNVRHTIKLSSAITCVKINRQLETIKQSPHTHTPALCGNRTSLVQDPGRQEEGNKLEKERESEDRSGGLANQTIED